MGMHPELVLHQDRRGPSGGGGKGTAGSSGSVRPRLRGVRPATRSPVRSSQRLGGDRHGIRRYQPEAGATVRNDDRGCDASATRNEAGVVEVLVTRENALISRRRATHPLPPP